MTKIRSFLKFMARNLPKSIIMNELRQNFVH